MSKKPAKKHERPAPTPAPPPPTNHPLPAWVCPHCNRSHPITVQSCECAVREVRVPYVAPLPPIAPYRGPQWPGEDVTWICNEDIRRVVK